MLQSMGSELDTTQGLNNNKYFYKIILLLTHTLSHIHVLFIHCVALRAPSTLCFLCLNGCLWPLGDPVEPPHSIFVCVCVCVCVCLPHCTTCGILVPWPEIKLRSSAAKALSPNHWTTREFLSQSFVFPEAAQNSSNRTQQMLAEKAQSLNSGPREEFLGV